ncbi:MAG: TolC family protein [Deltaproteobacteria bacterium]|nr:TolC family protein [Deltaproteobacteria bacterium]
MSSKPASPLLVIMLAVSAVGAPSRAAAEEARAASGSTPSARPANVVSLGEAVARARVRAFDILAATARVRGAEADVRTSAALPNPTLSAAPARRMDCWGHDCEAPWGAFVSLSDEGLIEGAISRKRALREEVARHALDVARWDARDAERLIVAQTKIQYVRTVAADVRVDFARTVARSLERTVAVDRVRYPRVIDEAQLARVEIEAQRAAQEVARAEGASRQERIELAWLLDAAGDASDLQPDRHVLDFRVPEALGGADRDALVSLATGRPDLRSARSEVLRADAAVRQAERARTPDVALVLGYQQLGAGRDAPQPPTFSVGVALPLPIFEHNAGPIARAEADREASAIERRRLESRIAADVGAAYEAYLTSRAVVERYEGSLLERATKAREITEAQYGAGAITLTDFLDAQRSWAQVNSDYTRELVEYWTSLVLLERAVGKEIVR